ncbi:MAG: hydantoinase B/oxoprolinase family protein, partial [Acidobacteriota bacterium]
GALVEITVDGEAAPPKTVLWLDPDAVVALSPPGGAGYGDPLARDPERVLDDVVHGYVSLDAARELYGVVIDYLGRPDQRVRLPAHYRLDSEATTALRGRR